MIRSVISIFAVSNMMPHFRTLRHSVTNSLAKSKLQSQKSILSPNQEESLELQAWNTFLRGYWPSASSLDNCLPQRKEPIWNGELLGESAKGCGISNYWSASPWPTKLSGQAVPEGEWDKLRSSSNRSRDIQWSIQAAGYPIWNQWRLF